MQSAVILPIFLLVVFLLANLALPFITTAYIKRMQMQDVSLHILSFLWIFASPFILALLFKAIWPDQIKGENSGTEAFIAVSVFFESIFLCLAYVIAFIVWIVRLSSSGKAKP
jgi:hypothetical protein